MLDDLKEEEIVNKVGGRFKLSTLIQKRMVMLNTGAKPLVDPRSGDRMAIVLQEIQEDKIYLDPAGEVATTNMTILENLPAAFLPGVTGKPPAAAAAPPAEAGPATVAEACGRRQFIAKYLCEEERCEEARFRNTEACVVILGRKRQRESR